MTKTFFTLFLFTLLASCSTAKKPFGAAIIENTADTTLSKKEVLRIRNLNNAIFDSVTFAGKEQRGVKYRLYKPKQQKSNEKFPLVIVYHGSGRPMGTDNKSQLGILQKLFASPEIQSKYPAYVLAPQFLERSSDYVTDTKRNLLASKPRPALHSVLQLVDSLKASLNIDSKRVYVVGFSMGGSTVINSLAARPDLFAAGISISGIPQFDKIEELKTIPIWLIHGLDDTENPIDSDEQFYKEMSSNIRFWKLKETTHDNIFSTTILGETLPEWLFQQRKK
jgi:predicted peptidase